MSKLYDLLYTMIGKLNSSVKTTPQTLTDAEKTQARSNIGAQVTGDYAKKSEIPTVPTKVSAFTNDAGYLTEHQDLSEYAKKDEIPSKLPNPHALTINGKTYDGSSAVSVTVEGGSGGGADWNASEGEPGHVLNRTHWIDVDIVEILPETQAKIQSSQYDEALSFVPLLEVKQGDIITVAINGMEYKCAAQAFQNNMYVFGDGNYFGFGNSGAGEPFCVLYMAGSNSGVYVKQDCTISIYKDNSIIHKLDKKFLPDNIGGADWNASEGEPGHVLNRTHWVERVEVLAETTITKDGAQNEVRKDFDYSLGLKVGETYIVTYNGVKYECVALDLGVAVEMLSGMAGLGNFEHLGLSSNGEPFYIFDSGSAANIFASAFGDVISIHADTIHKLDPKFLPDGVPYCIDSGRVDVLPECQPTYDESEGAFIVENSPILVAGKTYTVKWNGTEYACVAQDFSAMQEGAVAVGNMSDMGGVGNGEPFAVMYAPVPDVGNMIIIAPFDGITELTISIYQGSAEIRKLDNRCLDLEWLPVIKLTDTTLCEWAMDMPTSGTKSLLSKDYIIKMIDGEKYTVTWNGTTYERIGHAVAVTVDGFTATFYYIGNTSLSSLITAWNIDTVSMTDTGEPFLYEMLVIVTDSSCVGYLHADKNVSSTFIIKGPAPTPNKLPEVFLPESVDGIVVRSSTADSTKLFKITVDDTGAITATEV